MAEDYWIHTDEGQHWLNCVREAGGAPGPGDSALEWLDRVVFLATGKPATEATRKAARLAYSDEVIR